MTRKNIRTICYIISAVLAIAFVVKTIIDYFRYDALVTSAPFSVNILVNALMMVVPAIVVLIIGLVAGSRQ